MIYYRAFAVAVLSLRQQRICDAWVQRSFDDHAGLGTGGKGVTLRKMERVACEIAFGLALCRRVY